MADTDSLKQKNLLWLGVYLVFYGLVFAWIFLGRPMALDALKALTSLDVTKAAGAVGLTLAVILLNGLPSANVKATLVFWGLSFALPGTRFMQLAQNDRRIDMEQLRQMLGSTLPTTPSEQNAVWYRLYRKHEAQPSVRAGHQEYLLFRDLTWLTVLLAVAGGACTYYYTAGGRPAIIYLLITTMFYFLFSMAARNAGNRFVVTVLACEMATVEIKPQIII